MEKIVNDEFIIRPFQDEDLPQFKELLRTTWNENHIFLKSEELMVWQYTGFGKDKGMHFPSMFDQQGRMIGFRGVYPTEINIPCPEGGKTETLATGSLYLVIPEHRGKKLGLALQQFTQECYGNYLAIGSNLGTSAPIYRKSNYLMMDMMHRYIIMINDSYKNLLLDKTLSFPLCQKIYGSFIEDDTNITSEELEKIWKESPCSKMLSINKSKEFWAWRYKNHPIYKYFFFGGKGKGGVVVGRICNLYNEKREKQETTIFRILEIIPEGDSFCSDMLNRLLLSVVKWAEYNGCCMVETYMTTNKYNKLLTANDFIALPSEVSQKVVSNYEPMAVSSKLTNVSLYLGDEHNIENFDSVYFSLADSDQDRPNIV